MALRVMDRHRRGRGEIAPVPAGPEGIGGCRRRLVEPQQGHVGGRVGGHQAGAALRRGGLRDRQRAAVGAGVHCAAGGALVFPVDHQGGRFRRRFQAVVGGQEQGIAVAAAAVDQLPGAQEAAAAAAEGIAPDRADLFAPGIALGADGVDVATAGFQRVGGAAVAVTDVAEFERQQRAFVGRQHQLDQCLGTRHHRQRQAALARVVRIGVGAVDHAALGVAEPQLGALRQAPALEVKIDADRVVGADRQAP